MFPLRTAGRLYQPAALRTRHLSTLPSARSAALLTARTQASSLPLRPRQPTPLSSSFDSSPSSPLLLHSHFAPLCHHVQPIRFFSSGPFQPLRGPPLPSSLGAPRPARTYTRLRRRVRRLALILALIAAVYLADRQICASGLARSLRTFGTGLLVALDYKINFRPEPVPLIGQPGGIPALHRRSAERLSELLRHNGGLYLKIGQAVAMQSALLPPEFQRMFARMFDDAPSVPWADVERVIRQDFGGRSPEEVFGVSFAPPGENGEGSGSEKRGLMERTARASASVAQVHWARLPDGREVAVKIQKPDIKKQISWDLWAFKVVTWVYSRWFDLPLYSLVPFITERLELETDFLNEAQNSETMRKLVASEPALRGRVYVPPVYTDLSSARVLTTEWIEGARLWDRDAITGPWLGPRGAGSPGVAGGGTPLEAPDPQALLREKLKMKLLAQEKNPHAYHTRSSHDDVPLKPDRTAAWRGPAGRGGLGLSEREVMATMVDLFAAQIFRWGVVHCDPHPGNLFVRRLPSGRAELVLIDHGLYVRLSPQFRRQYAAFWTGLLTFDNATITRVTEEWGIRAPDLFASATLMRPYEGGTQETKKGILAGADDKNMTSAERHYEMQRRMKQGIREILADEDRWPKELLFIGRNMRIVQGNNQYMGSPVNRIKIMGYWASASLSADPGLTAGGGLVLTWRDTLAARWRHLVFRAVLWGTDLAFYFFRVRQWLGLGAGMEDEIENSMRGMARDMGVELQHGVFEG